MEVPFPRRSPFWHSLSFKLLVVGILILLMLIPGAMIRELIREREETRVAVITDIGSKWGRGQTLAGPVLTIPYYLNTRKEDKTYRELRYLHFLPEELDIEARVEPEIRYRGIYKAVVYRSVLRIRGDFLQPATGGLKIKEEDLLPGEAFVQVGVTDMRGIQESPSLHWGMEKTGVEPGIPTADIAPGGFHAPVALNLTGPYDFSMDLVLNGSEFLYFLPAGKTTRISVESPWAHPGFDGAFLPDEREVGPEGFKADWKVLHLNRNYPQAWKGSSYRMEESAFGVNLILPADHYQKTMRSAKYAVLFIALTFMVFFFVEVLNKKRIHPVQYLLVGLSISIFYLLLLSLGEQIGFNPAYGISGLAVVGLITAYSASFFRNARLTLLLAFCLAVLYAYLFFLIQLKDYALLMGAIGLFVAMALIMYASRKVDWYGGSVSRNGDRSVGFGGKS